MQDISFKEGLSRLKKIDNKKNVSISKIVECLGTNAAQIIVIIFSAPTALPTPALPLLTQILSAIVLITLFQLLIRRNNIWLPEKLKRKLISKETVTVSAKKLLKYHKKIEGIIKPRVKILSSVTAEGLIYIFCIFLSVVVALPIPFSNTAPSIAMILIMLGLIEKDGIIILGGIIFGIVGVTSLFLVYFHGAKLVLG